MSAITDLCVIGGGIHGAGAALEAAARGHSVLLLEKKALAWATSSRSSKLIHGGLRYLEHGHLGLVQESLRERRWLLERAPDLVKSVRFHIPLYANSRRSPLTIRAGLALYAALAGFTPMARFRRLPRSEWGGLDGLATEGLEAVFRYRDAQTDDDALTRAVARAAENLGAELAVPATFERLEWGKREGVVTFNRAGRQESRTVRAAVNAAGPWVNRVLERVAPRPTRLPMEWIAGAHLEIDAGLAMGIYYLEAPRDGRPVFAMPWKGRLLLGTTETPFTGDPDRIAPTQEEERYLREVLDHHFPALGERPTLNRFAGLRVLPQAPGGLNARSRESLIQTDRQERPRMATLYGGKLTTYRAAAEALLDRLAPSLPAAQRVADTRSLPLTPG